MKTFYFKLLQFSKLAGGFTLIELLVAMVITSIIVTLAGGGLFAIMRANNKAEDETLRRIELNRAIDFISDEVRMSKSIERDTVNINIPGFTPASQTTSQHKVLVLNLPTSTGVTTPIVYYVASPTNSSPWSGPKAVYRWGPPLLINGQYSTTPPQNEVLIDFIADSTPTPNCTSPYTPTNISATGFYVCVDSTGRAAQLYLHGKLTNSSQPYPINTTVFARSQ
jgi:prepilin-type N-terminal cleavage/methylation domain-containing protein